jgi:hypothetical protein
MTAPRGTRRHTHARRTLAPALTALLMPLLQASPATGVTR